MTISAIFIVILLFYGGSIIFDEVLFNYYDELTNTFQWVSTRRSYMTMQILTLREVLITQSLTYESDLRGYIEGGREIEQDMQVFLTTGSSILQQFKDTLNTLDSSQFCNYFEAQFGNSTYEECITENDGAMLRGMSINIEQIYANVESLFNSYYNYKQQNLSTFNLTNTPQYDFCSIYFVY